MRPISFLLMLLLSGASVSAFAQKNNAALLFFQHADNGTIQPDQQAGCYQMRLSGVDKQVIYLSNSPEEITGRLSIPVFITSWQHQQATQSIKPNAILHANLVTTNKKVTQISDVFVLKSVSYQSGDGAMTYRICRFNDEAAFKVGKLQDINIFIDPFHRWPP